MRVPRVPYRPIPCIDHGYRGTFDFVVIHDEEGLDADGYFRSCTQPELVGAHFQVKRDGGSVQWADTTRLVYHAVGGNLHGVGIELGGYASYSREQWLSKRAQLREAARITGYLLAKKHKFPRHGDTVLGHYQLPAGGHHDPGTGFPWDTFMMYVRMYYRLYRAKIVATRSGVAEAPRQIPPLERSFDDRVADHVSAVAQHESRQVEDAAP